MEVTGLLRRLSTPIVDLAKTNGNLVSTKLVPVSFLT